MKSTPTLDQTPTGPLCLHTEPCDCPEWCAFYDVRHGGIECSCMLEKGHASCHMCRCGFQWGVGAVSTVRPVGAEMLHALGYTESRG
jgi:hypothetical protein